MIDLNKPIQAREDKVVDFSPAPEGEYLLRITDIKPWEKKVLNTVQVIERDQQGNALKDDKGKNITQPFTNVEIYNTFITLEIVEGEHEGKRVFHNLTTHPNMPFTIPAFIFGLGLESLTAGEIPNVCVGMLVHAKVKVDEYEKTFVNKKTGLEETSTRTTNRVHYFKDPGTELTSHNEGIAKAKTVLAGI